MCQWHPTMMVNSEHTLQACTPLPQTLHQQYDDLQPTDKPFHSFYHFYRAGLYYRSPQKNRLLYANRQKTHMIVCLSVVSVRGE